MAIKDVLKVVIKESHAGDTIPDAVVGYHATPCENVERILADGLIATGDCVGYGADPRVTYHGVPAVHMNEEEEAASSFIQCLYELNDSEVAVFQVDLRGLEVRVGWDGPSTLAVERNIEPTRLMLLR